jgi:alpha-tubulin suppressor-like RCC1 family protein
MVYFILVLIYLIKKINHIPSVYFTKGKFISTACGLFHSLILREDGTLFTLGSNEIVEHEDFWNNN